MNQPSPESSPSIPPRPRVALVVGKDPLKWNRGGAVNYARSHALAAQRAGYEVHLFCLAVQDEEIRTEFGLLHRVRGPRQAPDGATAANSHRPADALLQWARTLGYREVGAHLYASALTAAVVQFVVSQGTDCVLHGFSTWGGIVLEARSQLSRLGLHVPVVNSLYTSLRHEQEGKQRGLRTVRSWLPHFQLWIERWWVGVPAARLEQRVVKESPVLIVNYAAVRDLLELEYGPLPQLSIMPYCEAGGFSELKSAPHESEIQITNGIPHLVTLSRHDPRKGLDIFIRALAVLHERGVEFRATLGSSGDLLTYHQNLTRSLGLQAQVSFSGWLDDPAPLLDSGDIFVLPSLEEGSGSIALLEAMRYGLAVVVSDVDGIPEVITGDVEGLLVPPGDSAALAAALTRLIHDRPLRERLARAASARHALRADPARFTAALGGLYDRLRAGTRLPEEMRVRGR